MFEGSDGWYLSIPSIPVEAGKEVQVWVMRTPRNRVDNVTLQIASSGGSPVSETEIDYPADAKEGWIYLPPERSKVGRGEYVVSLLDENSESLVEAKPLVVK